MQSIYVVKTSTELIKGSPNFWTILVYYEDTKNKTGKLSIETEEELSEEERYIYEILKQWRFDKSTKENVPAFVICHNSELMSIARLKPLEIDAFRNIKGFGENKTARHGEEIIALLNSIKN